MRFLRATLILLIGLFVTPSFAQLDQHPPQFLYREEDRLIMVNGYTGETTELPLVVSDQDRFKWSPDGAYLLALIHDEVNFWYCLNLYNVDIPEWVYPDPISCSVKEAVFSQDGTQMVYSTTDDTNDVLWLYSLADTTSEELYRTTHGDGLRQAGIGSMLWSPTETYLTFVSYAWIMGGTLNSFNVMNMMTREQFTLTVPQTYYASYDPIWSPDDQWFLIMLQEQYVTSGTIVHTNHEGDVYLVNSQTGEKYRLTYSPADREYDIRWTDDGGIAFTTVIIRREDSTFTLEQAMNVDAVPSEKIFYPEPFDAETFYDPLAGVIISPDPNLGVWVNFASTSEGSSRFELTFGDIFDLPRTARFSIPIAKDYRHTGNLIGWRPSDYPYAQG